MLIVNIMGGLGNQMFQFACGKALAIKTGQELLFTTDSLSSYQQHRVLELDSAFGVQVSQASSIELKKLLGPNCRSAKFRRLLTHRYLGFWRGSKFIVEQGFSFVENLDQRSKYGAYLHGYWQSEDYFSEYKDEILDCFSFVKISDEPNQILLDEIAQSNSIGIHVRRGDYVSNPKANAVHGVLEKDHYISALKEFRDREPTAKIYAFSDDPAWVSQNILNHFENAKTVNLNSGENSFRDMQLMSKCQSLVVANSSFSWWAAWLNTREDKTIIAPKDWFQSKRLDSSRIVPDSWLRR